MNSRAIYAVVAILAIVISAVNASVGDFGGSLDFVRAGSSSLFSGCKGSIAECIAEEEEMEFDSDISRRILAQKKYVSYGAMRKNSVPCSRRGASYYNCQRGAQANPYRRGCSTITRCRRGKPRLIPTKPSIRARTVICGKMAKTARTQDGHSSWSSITSRPRALGYFYKH
ncbi:unnamed protein product [Brassica oleracea var. botrytis]